MRPIRKAVGKFRSLTAEHQGPLAVAAMASYEAEWHQAHGYDLVIRHLGAERNVFDDAEFQVGSKCEWGGKGGGCLVLDQLVGLGTGWGREDVGGVIIIIIIIIFFELRSGR